MMCCFGYKWNYGGLIAPNFFALSFRSLRDGLLIIDKRGGGCREGGPEVLERGQEGGGGAGSLWA